MKLKARCVAAMLIAALFSVAARASSPGIDSLPKPWVIAHRGGMLLWPEHSMRAYMASTAEGNHFVEVDCMLLADGEIAISHEPTILNEAGEKVEISKLSQLEWLKIQMAAPNNAGRPLFNDVLRHFGNRKILFVEPKDGRSGDAIVRKLKEYSIRPSHVVVNSFDARQLEPARGAGYRTCLNLFKGSASTPQDVKLKGFWAVALPANDKPEEFRRYKDAGFVVLAYTLNRHHQRDTLLGLGVDGFFTDDPIYAGARNVAEYRDAFASGEYRPGMLETLPGGRGFFENGAWVIDTSAENRFLGCLQGWLAVPASPTAEWQLDLTVGFGPALQSGRWASVALFDRDIPIDNDGRPSQVANGYNFVLHNNGGLSVYRYADGAAAQLIKSTPGKASLLGQSARYSLTYSAGAGVCTLMRGEEAIVTVEGVFADLRYITFGAKGQRAAFSQIKLSVTRK